MFLYFKKYISFDSTVQHFVKSSFKKKSNNTIEDFVWHQNDDSNKYNNIDVYYMKCNFNNNKNK